MTRLHALRATGRAPDEDRRPAPGGREDVALGDAADSGPSGGILGPVSPATIAHVQRTAGNAAAMKLVQRQSVEDEQRPYGAKPPAGGAGLPAPAEMPGGGAGAAGAGPDGESAEAAPAPAAAPPGGAPAHRTLRVGTRGPDVEDLQNRLNAAGATPALEPDGIFGRLTRAAVVAYQSGHDLDPDGVVGPLTWGRLDPAAPGGGGGEGPQPQPQDPLAGIVVIAGHSASAAAIARARTQAVELYGNLAPANRARLVASPITVDVIPHDKQLTDLPEYAHLRGTNTFDGRLWDNVRGIQTTIAGATHVAVAEEDLVAVAGTAASYGPGFLEAHEGGHGLQTSGLTPTQVATLATIYAARVASTGPITQATPAGAATAKWLSPAWYSAANKEEYFANSVAAYHSHPYTSGAGDQAMYTRAWLQANDAPMFQLLQAIYQQQGATP